MISNILGSYLVEKGRITAEQLQEILDEMTKVRVKLGLIAVAEGMITPEQADKINRLQAVLDKRFGDIAVLKGYLTEKQVDELLKLQGNPYLAFAQSLENLGMMSFAQLDEVMKEYQAENELTNSSMEDLKSDDVDRILPLFLPSDATEYLDLAGVVLRTIMRCVDDHVMPLKAYFDTELKAEQGAMQLVEGQKSVICGFAGNGQALLPTASYFGHEDFQTVDMDALDAVAELINCINGLYASALSQQRIEMDLCPPEFSDSIDGFYGEKMLVFPMVIYGETVNVILAIGNSLEMR